MDLKVTNSHVHFKTSNISEMVTFVTSRKW